jgi:hypothetical protein
MESPRLSTFHERIRELLDANLPLDEQGRLRAPLLRLSPGAFAIWRNYHDEIESELKPLRDYASVMGGPGSGNRWRYSANSATDEYRTLDVRWFARAGVLRPGYWGGWQWTRGGDVMASIHEIQGRPCSTPFSSRLPNIGVPISMQRFHHVPTGPQSTRQVADKVRALVSYKKGVDCATRMGLRFYQEQKERTPRR